MKKALLKILIQAGTINVLYAILLRVLAGTNIVAGCLCPGPHLPAHYPVLMALFICSRLYVILLPGILLNRIGTVWLKQKYK